ncbi:rhomboid family intramembrane serine protease [Nocardioides sp. LHD-245]|uniref:rhomboid family intramembrane serine protease n=1 Tax=Nocardioides sp. LHD-245 TaxID=3051387 RepID=UPI0027E1879F|nr:rhomboid family intramembrane serine protease [Nocardioides sp. LHD-245]
MSTPPVGVPTCYRHSDRETWIRCQRCERPICPDCMREASVGFQCPDCVAEGRASMRQAKTAYGGGPSSNPALTSIVLIVINAAVWVAITASGGGASRLAEWLALRTRGFCLDSDSILVTTEAACKAGASSRWIPGVHDGAYWEMVTALFTHVQPLHLGFNMLALWFLGPQLEHVLGRARFLALYFLSGVAGSVAVYWLSGGFGGTVGASGAVFGLMGALVVIATKIGANPQQLLMWIGINVVLTFTLPNVSWQGHFGGLVGGAAVAAVLVFAPKERRTAVQVGGLSAIGAVLVVATVLRTLTLT